MTMAIPQKDDTNPKEAMNTVVTPSPNNTTGFLPTRSEMAPIMNIANTNPTEREPSGDPHP